MKYGSFKYGQYAYGDSVKGTFAAPTATATAQGIPPTITALRSVTISPPTGGASGQVLKYSASGTATWQADSDTITTINGKTGAISKADIVALGIPEQDTVYSHPSTHPASMITGLPTSLPANGGNADTVGGFTVGANVPTGAKFTDTVYTHPSTHSISEISGLQTALDSKVDEPVQIKRW